MAFSRKHKNAEDRPVPFLSGIVDGGLIVDTPNGTARATGTNYPTTHEGAGHDAWERQSDQSWRDGGNATGE